MASFPPLPAIESSISSFQVKALPSLDVLFHIPNLVDKARTISVPRPAFAPSLTSDSLDQVHIRSAEGVEQSEGEKHVISDYARPFGVDSNFHDSQVLSWDNLKPIDLGRAGSILSPFLSEGGSSLFDVALNYSRLEGPEYKHIRLISESHLRESLLLNIVGSASTLYAWDKSRESFVLSATSRKPEKVLRVAGLTESSSVSLTHRFLNIGILLRRLESFVTSLRLKSNPPVTHAFSHSLSILVNRTRASLFQPEAVSSLDLVALWLSHEEIEWDLQALADLCNREITKLPPYPTLLVSESDAVLSHIHSHLTLHFSRSSPLRIRALLAFIFTSSSAYLMRHFGMSLGLLPSNEPPHVDDREKDDEDDNAEPESMERLPSFVRDSVAKRLSRAKRSLKLLKRARPDHPLCEPKPEWRTLCAGLLWTDEGVCNLINVLEEHMKSLKSQISVWRTGLQSISARSGQPRSSDHQAGADLETQLMEAPPPIRSYPRDLSAFKTFDLEPGFHISTSKPKSFLSPSGGLQKLDADHFIDDFPRSLPSDAPTVDHLIDITMLNPLVSHANLLSSSLLDLFLTDLHLMEHLDLLRRFILLGDAGFVSRLRSALFSDDVETEEKERGQSKTRKNGLGILARVSTENGVGLGLGLSERDPGSWPPGGSELSFLLRRVVVDTLRSDGEQHFEIEREQDRSVLVEAEWRLGFALSELDEEDEDGQAKWLDPMSIEALDFLYMLYNPPPTIAVLITEEILYKYRRVFTFLLQLLRVEAVTRTLYHSALKQDKPLFDNLLSSRSLFYRFRFQVQHFVSSLITYVFDTAIGVNWTFFINRLTKLSNPDHNTEDELEDVFSILDYHSAVLDSILEGCLLKARHKTAGGILKDCLQTVLLLGKLVRDLREGDLHPGEASARLASLHQQFEVSMARLIHALEKLDGRGQARRLWLSGFKTVQQSAGLDTLRDHDLEMLMKEDKNPSPGLGDLLLRLDMNDWYRNKK